MPALLPIFFKNRMTPVLFSFGILLLLHLSMVKGDHECENYYDNINMDYGKWGSIKEDLHTLLVSTHRRIGFNKNREILRMIENNPTNKSHLITIYGRESIYASANRRAEWSWEPLHIWPTDYGMRLFWLEGSNFSIFSFLMMVL